MDLKHGHKIGKVQTNGTVSWIKTAKVKNWPEKTSKLKRLNEEPEAETLPLSHPQNFKQKVLKFQLINQWNP